MLNEKVVELEQVIGILGEMFGVVCQVFFEVYGCIVMLIVSVQYLGCDEFLVCMFEEFKGFLNIDELEELWILL